MHVRDRQGQLRQVAAVVVNATSQRRQQLKLNAIDRAGREALDCLKAPLLTLFDPEDSPGHTAFQRAAAHLVNVHEQVTLEPGEDIVEKVAAWLRPYLKYDPKPPAAEILDFQ